MKLISKEQIDWLPRWDRYRNREGRGEFVSYDVLRAVYDNAPSVGNSEPVDISFILEAYRNGQFSDDFDYPLIKPLRKEIRSILDKHPFYSTPQPDRVVELEAKLKEYGEAIEAMVEDGWLLCGHEGLSEPQQKVYDAYVKIKG